MIDPSAQAMTSRGIQLAGVPVTFQRLTGVAPNVVTTSAAVTAIIRSVVVDTTEETKTGYSASKPGAITQDDRLVIVMASDLQNAGFPLPVQKNDKVIATWTGEKFNVTRVDGTKRAMAGAIECTITGVS